MLQISGIVLKRYQFMFWVIFVEHVLQLLTPLPADKVRLCGWRDLFVLHVFIPFVTPVSQWRTVLFWFSCLRVESWWFQMLTFTDAANLVLCSKDVFLLDVEVWIDAGGGLGFAPRSWGFAGVCEVWRLQTASPRRNNIKALSPF